ncbi:thioesterase family protein [Mycobacterium sp. URHB0044]|jgi:acyl-CoA thioester hydrolase|uniref:acyl-CoA thioesterase n=1 Tax=Mycobacterium sp. URHB0044 TaxID=1380386 RepID=UPI000689050F|nr:thioesterase family protein [Mycobacterium sp. URHB0044]
MTHGNTGTHRSDVADFVVTRSVSTRWADIDLFGHMTASVYGQLFDTAINGWLVQEAGYEPERAGIIGVVAHYECDYHREVRFPEALTVGLRVDSIGRTSVTYHAALFGAAGPDGQPRHLAAEARWVHVYIDRLRRRPVEIPSELRAFLELTGDRR